MKYIGMVVPAVIAVAFLFYNWNEYGELLTGILLLATVLAFTAATMDNPRVNAAAIFTTLAAVLVLVATTTWSALMYTVPLIGLVALAIAPQQELTRAEQQAARRRRQNAQRRK